MKKVRPIYVKWDDHYSMKDSWGSIELFKNSDEGYICETVGFLVYETKKCLFISLSYSGGEDGDKKSAQSLCILKCCIIKRKFIKI